MDKALAKDRDERYQHADDVLADLKHEKRLLESGEAGRLSTKATGWKSRRRILRVLIPAAAVVATAILLFVLEPFRVEMGPREEAAARGNSLAIMYFENLADPDDPEKLGEIVTNLLMTDLSESRYMSVVSGQRLYDILNLLGKQGARVVDRDVASEVARRAQAKWMLLGSILRFEQRVVLTSQLVEVGSGRILSSERVTGDPGEQVFSLVDKLAVAIRKDLSLPAAAQRELDRPVADVTTHSPEAYRYYLEGLNYDYRYCSAEARASYLKAIEYDSTFAMAYYGLAGSESGTEQRKQLIDKALKYSNKVSERERLYLRAWAAGESRKYSQAIEELQHLLERYPDDKEALDVLAHCYGVMQNYEQTIAYFNRIIELDPLYMEAYNGLAYVYERTGDFDKSIWAADKYISLAPDEHNPYDTRGDIYAWNGRIDQAIESYGKALEIKPGFEPTISKLGHMYLFKQDYPQAETYYQKLCMSADKETRCEGRSRLAYILMFRGKLEEALRMLDAGILADRMERSEVWIIDKYWAKSEIYLERNEPAKAVEEYSLAMETAKQLGSNSVGLMNAAYAKFLAQNHEIARAAQAVEALRNYLQAGDDLPMGRYWYALGWVELAKNDKAAALSNFEKATAAERDFSRYCALGKMYLDMGQLAEAVAALERAISRYDGDRAGYPFEAVKIHYWLGLAYEKSGWNKKAIEKYEEFLEIWKDADPGIPEVEDAHQCLTRIRQSS
jgi:tetratricopeptide (TPR) repeat protein